MQHAQIPMPPHIWPLLPGRPVRLQSKQSSERQKSTSISVLATTLCPSLSRPRECLDLRHCPCWKTSACGTWQFCLHCVTPAVMTPNRCKIPRCHGCACDLPYSQVLCWIRCRLLFEACHHGCLGFTVSEAHLLFQRHSYCMPTSGSVRSCVIDKPGVRVFSPRFQSLLISIVVLLLINCCFLKYDILTVD